jgi:adenylate cyclase
VIFYDSIKLKTRNQRFMTTNRPNYAATTWQFCRQHRVVFLLSAVICILSLHFYFHIYIWPSQSPNTFLQFLENIELKTLDARFQLRELRETKQPGPAVVIVAIDPKSQDVLGRWPFPRSYFAQAVNFLREAHARVIAFDLNFPQPDANSGLEALRTVQGKYEGLVPPSSRTPAFEQKLKDLAVNADNDKQFADALSHYDNAVLGYFVVSQEEARAQNQDRLKSFLDVLSFQAYPATVHPEFAKNAPIPEAQAVSPDLPEFASAAKNFGFFDITPDPDGVVRRVPAVLAFQGSYYPSLAIAAALAYTNDPLDQVKLIFNPNGVQKIVMGNRTIPTDRQGFVQLDYLGKSGTFPTYSLSDVVQRRLPPEVFRDRLVLIGPTARGISGMALTPTENAEFPGVEIHATMIDDILYQHFIRRGFREHLVDIAFILLFSIGATIIFSILTPLRATVYLGFSQFVYFWLTYFAFAHDRIWVADFLPMATLFATYAAVVSYRFFFEEGEKRKVRAAFSQYIHPAQMAKMLDDPEGIRLGGEEKELTALFSDIRGFTTLSENLSPPQLVELLNEYLTAMTEVIFKNWGTLDKYIGDAIMAFWGAPYAQEDHALRACRTGLAMIKALQVLQADWHRRNVPRIDIGVGINSGPMLVGNMGSKIRKNYTIMGDSVNLASRLEGSNREFGTHVIISESTYILVKGNVVAREIDLIRVKGKTQPVKVYELLSLAADGQQHLDLVTRFERGLEAYRSGEWQAAIDIFHHVLADYPQDGPSQVFIERCLNLLARPPEGLWDGVFIMKTK